MAQRHAGLPRGVHRTRGGPARLPAPPRNGRRLLAQEDRIETLLPGHWNGELSFAGFEARLRYVETLWDGIRKDGKTEKALALFRVNTELYPESWNVWDSLGEALLKAGDADGARRIYEESVALNSGNENGKEALARLRGEGTKG